MQYDPNILTDTMNRLITIRYNHNMSSFKYPLDFLVKFKEIKFTDNEIEANDKFLKIEKEGERWKCTTKYYNGENKTSYFESKIKWLGTEYNQRIVYYY